MTAFNMLFNPQSIAILGETFTLNSIENIIITNLKDEGFKGQIIPIKVKFKSNSALSCCRDIDELIQIPDIVIICTNADKHLILLEKIAQKGIKLSLLLGPYLSSAFLEKNELYLDGIKKITMQSGMRIIGPNSLGIILPWLNINAFYSPIKTIPGNIAFISQSTALCCNVLDWAKHKKIGFSAVISIADSCDIDIPELLDHLSRDTKTTAILLCIDNIFNPRAFISAARAASQHKRILILKNGRTWQGSHLLTQKKQVPFGINGAYDAAISRSGMLQVNTTNELFLAVETLSHLISVKGERIAFISNGITPAIMALDTLLEKGGQASVFSAKTISKLEAALPYHIFYPPLVDIGIDADIHRYISIIDILLTSDDIDALLIMHSPSLNAPCQLTADAISQMLAQHPCRKKITILTNWQGESAEACAARLTLSNEGSPAYRTPESAATAFMLLLKYRINQQQLMQTPSSLGQVKYDILQCNKLIQEKITTKETQLLTHEIAPLFSQFAIDVAPTWFASCAKEAEQISKDISYPAVIKIQSSDIDYKSNVNGVVLNLKDSSELTNAVQLMLHRVNQKAPNAQIDGLQIQSMINKATSHKLRVCVTVDEVFGPIILLGQGDTPISIYQDMAIALPPLNMNLAKHFVINAITSAKINQYSHNNELDIYRLCRFLVTVSQMIVDLPDIKNIDINPLLISCDQTLILDASMTLSAYKGNGNKRLVICPYPKYLEQVVLVENDKKLLLRPIIPEDEAKHQSFLAQVNADDLYFRFFSHTRQFDHDTLAHLTQIDYDREMAFIAIYNNNQNEEEIWGVVRAFANPQHTAAEFAILVRSDKKNCKIGSLLMNKLISYGKQSGIIELNALTMPINNAMLALAKKQGFTLEVQLQDSIVKMNKRL